MNMWIVGMMGSGKTTAGRLAAESLEVAFHDTDDIVVERMGCSIAQFWGERGEAAFRDVEKVATASLATSQGINAAGGGVVLDEDNRRILGQSDKVVWLRAEPEQLVARIESHHDRPLVAATEEPHLETFETILGQRSRLYSEVATHEIVTEDLTATQVAARLEEIWLS